MRSSASDEVEVQPSLDLESARNPSIGDAAAPARGFAPRDAIDWLRLHQRFALSPEVIAPGLEAGLGPREILSGGADGAARDVRGSLDEARSGFDRDIRRLEEIAARVVPRPDRAYPDRLAALVDAPGVLLVRGQPEVLSSPGIAIVGARAATRAARATARTMARELASEGVTIISGLARGIDAEAHRGALEAGGKTIAVLACGPDRIYPPEHRGLADEICREGAVLSEMPVGSPPRRAYFPLRNRLISGLSIGVLVVEARRRSGSLITVRHALNQGREVFVVPGAIDGPFAQGTNALLRDGARPVLSARDVLDDLGWSGPPRASLEKGSSQRAIRETTRSIPESAAEMILAILEEGPLTRDAVVVRSRLEPGTLARALLELELANRVVLDRDGRLQRNWS